MPSKFILQTPNEFDPSPPSQASEGARWAPRPVLLFGPFTDEETALYFVEQLHLTGSAGDGTYEFIIDAQDVEVNVDAEVQ